MNGENKCPICLENLSKYDSVVLAGNSISCRHEFCLDCIETYFSHRLRENDGTFPVTLKCPVCNSEYVVVQTVSEIYEPVLDIDYINEPIIDLTGDAPVIDLTGDD